MNSPAPETPAEAPAQAPAEPDRIVWRRDVQRAFACCGETIRRYIQTDRLPPLDINITPKRQGWYHSTLAARNLRIP